MAGRARRTTGIPESYDWGVLGRRAEHAHCPKCGECLTFGTHNCPGELIPRVKGYGKGYAQMRWPKGKPPETKRQRAPEFPEKFNGVPKATVQKLAYREDQSRLSAKQKEAVRQYWEFRIPSMRRGESETERSGDIMLDVAITIKYRIQGPKRPKPADNSEDENDSTYNLPETCPSGYFSGHR